MATSKTGIAKLALSHIHNKTGVEDIETEQSVEANTARVWYDVARRQCLADFDWSFARTRLTLAAHTNAAPAEWGYRYQYPSDCIAPRRIPPPGGHEEDTTPYEVELAANGTRSIVTDLEDAVLVYTKDIETPSLFSPHFELTLSYILAYYLAGPLTAKAAIKREMIEAYGSMLQMAAAQDKNTQRERAPRDAAWIRGR